MNKADISTEEVVSDHEIILKILSGEKELYASIVRRYNQSLYRVGMSILNDDSEVEDSMQTAYINAYESLKNFGFRASFRTWITRILINECLLRLKKRGKSISMNDGKIENMKRLNATADNPANKLLNTELKTILNEAILKLPDIYRMVFVLREIENLSVAETQQHLNISEVNVKVRLNRAKAMLKELLSAHYKKEDLLHFHLSRCDRMIDNVMQYVRSH